MSGSSSNSSSSSRFTPQTVSRPARAQSLSHTVKVFVAGKFHPERAPFGPFITAGLYVPDGELEEGVILTTSQAHQTAADLGAVYAVLDMVDQEGLQILGGEAAQAAAQAAVTAPNVALTRDIVELKIYTDSDVCIRGIEQGDWNHLFRFTSLLTGINLIKVRLPFTARVVVVDHDSRGMAGATQREGNRIATELADNCTAAEGVRVVELR